MRPLLLSVRFKNGIIDFINSKYLIIEIISMISYDYFSEMRDHTLILLSSLKISNDSLRGRHTLREFYETILLMRCCQDPARLRSKNIFLSVQCFASCAE